MAAIEVKVPDIGDFKDVPVIEVFVKPGDTVKAEDSLVTLESDKATMDVPSPAAGMVKELKVKLGDKVSEGTVILTLESASAAARREARAPAAAPQRPRPPRRPNPPRRKHAVPAPAASAAPRAYAGNVDIECEMLVLGAGPGGYSAAFRAADLGMKTVLVERYPTLGGVCLNVGCIPSKALLHIAAVMDEVAALGEHGIAFGAPKVDLAKLLRVEEQGRRQADRRPHRHGQGAQGRGRARLRQLPRCASRRRRIDRGIRPGARPARRRSFASRRRSSPPARSRCACPSCPDDPRIVDSTGALELKSVPKRMLVVGGGIIGLEMGTVYSTLGARLDVVEMLDGLMLGADRDLVKVWEKMNKPRFDRVMLKTKTVAVEAKKDAIYVTFEGEQAPAGAAALRHGAAVGRPQPERQEDRRRQGGRGRHRSRLHSGRQSDAHQRAAHLRHRRHRRPADARAQGGARRARRGRGRGRPEVVLRRARHSVGRVHRSRSRVGRPDRGRSQGQGHQGAEGACFRGPRRAAPSPTAATKASPSCCSTTTRIASSAAASSARTPAT